MPIKRKRVVIVSTGQPATNPRLVKEADTLYEAGYDVTVCYSYWAEWAIEADKAILKDKKWKYRLVGGDPTKNLLNYQFSRFRFKLTKKFPWLFKAEMKLCRNYPELLYKTLKTPADLYIGHNLGTLPIVAKAALKNNAKCIFDFEDYHAGEHLQNSADFIFKDKIERKYLPYLNGVIFASPLIQKTYQAIFRHNNSIVIENAFSSKFINHRFKHYEQGMPLKIFWFSQTIGKNRGLEEIFNALAELKKHHFPFKLTLLGTLASGYDSYLKDVLKKYHLEDHVEIHRPVHEDEIFEIASQHHVGLATETAHTMNRDICLTNKIYTYLLSGNAILLSNTKAQTAFFEENNDCCQIYQRGNTDQIIMAFKRWLDQPELLNQQRLAALKFAKEKYNWEKESSKLIGFYNQM